MGAEREFEYYSNLSNSGYFGQDLNNINWNNWNSNFRNEEKEESVPLLVSNEMKMEETDSIFSDIDIDIDSDLLSQFGSIRMNGLHYESSSINNDIDCISSDEKLYYATFVSFLFICSNWY